MMAKGQGDYYLSLAAEDYYLDGGEPPGQWCGSGTLSLGLKGQVGDAALNALLQGVDPKDGRALVVNAGADNRRTGYDLTFSAPKSVSVLWSQSDSEI